jgi:pyrroline-5-carboxylate reductase
MKQQQKIGFIGCGNMTSAIIGGLVKQGFPSESIIVSNRSQEKLTNIKKIYNVSIASDNSQIVAFAETIILAVKPQMLEDVCEPLKRLSFSGKLVISIAAGTSTETIENYLSQSIAIIRAMPNTPSQILQGATGLYANQLAGDAHAEIAEAIFGAIGKNEWVDDESLIDVVTAIAGSSPAYIFLFLQAMMEQSIELGLPAEKARNLASQAVKGAAALVQEEHNKSLVDLRKAVTSPGGTTAAAIASFEQNHFSDIIKQAVTAAAVRGKELGEQN